MFDNIKDRYTYVTDNKENWQCVGVRGRRYDGVVYKYGKVTIPEKENPDGTLPFRFEYNIIDNVGIPREEFGEEFFTLIGDILVEIIDEQLEEENLEYSSND